MRHTAIVLILLLTAFPAAGQTVLRVSKDVSEGLPQMPLNIGMHEGIFARHGITVQETDFNGAAKMQMAIVAGQVDIGIGGGPELAYVAKGAPERAVAVISSVPAELSIAVLYDSLIQSPEALRGKRIAISTTGGLSHWLIREFSRSRGWGTDGVIAVPLGASQTAHFAALKTHQVDATIILTADGQELQSRNQARLVINCADYVHNFISHALFASNSMIDGNPAALRAFVRAWFESVAWMRSHKPETVQTATSLSGLPEAIQSAEYDEVMPTLSSDGHFDAEALRTLGQSFVDTDMLQSPPDMNQLVIDAFLK